MEPHKRAARPLLRSLILAGLVGLPGCAGPLTAGGGLREARPSGDVAGATRSCEAAAQEVCYGHFLDSMLVVRGGPLPDADGVEACVSRALAACLPARAPAPDLIAAASR